MCHSVSIEDESTNRVHNKEEELIELLDATEEEEALAEENTVSNFADDDIIILEDGVELEDELVERTLRDDTYLDLTELQQRVDAENNTVKALWNSLIIWNNVKDSQRYVGNSRTTAWRNRIRREADLKKNHDISSYFSNSLENKTHAQEELIKINECFQTLKDFLKVRINKNNGLNNMSDYECTKYRAVLHYFHCRRNKLRIIESSQIAAKLFWHDDASEIYRPLVIRSWARQYLETGEIAASRQGCHIKTFSYLSDENIALSVLSWFRAQDPQTRDLVMLKKYIDEEVVMDEVGQKRSVSLSTLSRFLANNGFKYKPITKQVYMDGHEREDVVKYRKEFVEEMMALHERMEKYDDHDYSIVTEPSLEVSGEQKLVMVTHDESTFYSNGYKVTNWLENNEHVLRRKGAGGSLMVSEFLCPCHGSVSRVIKACGKDNWWTSSDMISQLENDAIPSFERMHPGCQGLFLFDQSSNHSAMPKDALVVTKMNLNDERVPKDSEETLRDTAFNIKLYSGEVKSFPQSFYNRTGTLLNTERDKNSKAFAKRRKLAVEGRLSATTTSHKTKKGMQTILRERHLWPTSMETGGRPFRLTCNNDVPASDFKCCARHLLGSQPDFKGQRSAIQESVEGASHLFLLYPKFHCELNFIERYWGHVKNRARKNCDYTFKKLQENLPEFLNNGCTPATKLRGFYNRCWRYIEAYSDDKNAFEAEQLVKQFFIAQKSHRKLRKNQ